MAERVIIEHPDFDGRANVSQRAFDQTWAEKGFEVVSEHDDAESARSALAELNAADAPADPEPATEPDYFDTSTDQE